MKQNVSPLVLAGIIVAIVILIALIAKRTLFQDPNYSSVPWEETRAYKEQQRMRVAAPLTAPASMGQAPSHPKGAAAGGQ